MEDTPDDVSLKLLRYRFLLRHIHDAQACKALEQMIAEAEARLRAIHDRDTAVSSADDS